MSVFHHNSYRTIIREFVDTAKKNGANMNYSRLSLTMGVQKSYLSQALSGRCELNQDQLYRAAQLMNLTDNETDYLMLLLDRERTQIPERKSYLTMLLDNMRRDHIESVAS